MFIKFFSNRFLAATLLDCLLALCELPFNMLCTIEGKLVLNFKNSWNHPILMKSTSDDLHCDDFMLHSVLFLSFSEFSCRLVLVSMEH